MAFQAKCKILEVDLWHSCKRYGIAKHPVMLPLLMAIYV